MYEAGIQQVVVTAGSRQNIFLLLLLPYLDFIVFDGVVSCSHAAEVLCTFPKAGLCHSPGRAKGHPQPTSALPLHDSAVFRLHVYEGLFPEADSNRCAVTS